ncbi:hypothetical protein OROGR_023606 [Orobanche gracilis]
MAEEDANSEVKGPSEGPNPNSVEATIETSVGCGATESTCNNNNVNNAESSAVTDGSERENSFEYADELMARGSKAAKESDYVEATHCYSRALEIRNGKDEEDDDESDAEELADGDEDESDLDLAWKMLDVARAIVEKLSGDSMDKVDILSSLAEVALEREDVETSLSDYSKALSMLGRLVEPDSRLIAELRLMNEVKNFSGASETQAASESGQTVQPSSSTSVAGDSPTEKEAEIEILTGLCGELEKKLEDLLQLVSNHKHALADILGMMMSAKANATEESVVSVGMNSSQMGTCVTAGSTTSEVVSTAGTNGALGVTHLGVVGRGVKRVVSSTEQTGSKKPSIDPSSNNDGSTS